MRGDLYDSESYFPDLLKGRIKNEVCHCLVKVTFFKILVFFYPFLLFFFDYTLDSYNILKFFFHNVSKTDTNDCRSIRLPVQKVEIGTPFLSLHIKKKRGSSSRLFI